MKILFKLTSRSRHTNFFRALDSIIDNCTSDQYQILCSLDFDDKTMCNDEVRQSLAWYFHKGVPIVYHYGASKNKVDAINRDMEIRGHWDILVNVSDDQIFTVVGFDEIIRANMPADLDCFLHFPDGHAGERLATLSIMGRAYYDRFGYIYHPDYISLWCDNEAMEVAKKLGKYKLVSERIFEHLHPANGNAPTDAQYKKTESYYRIDEKTFNRRKAMNFYLPK